jgi:hypothetical protein
MGSMDNFVDLQKTLPKTLKEIEKIAKTSGALFGDELKNAQKLNDEIERISSGLKRASSKGALGLSRNLVGVAESVAAQYANIVGLVKERNELEARGNSQALRYADERLKYELKNIQKLERDEAKKARTALKDLIKYERVQERLARNMDGTIFDPKVNPLSKSAVTDMDAVSEYLEDKLGGVADTFSEALSGNLDSVFGSAQKFLKGSQKSLGGMSAILQAKGQAKGQTSEGSSLLSMFRMGKGLAGLTTTLTVAVGTLAGAFAIFKGLQALEENMKGIHKELIDSYGATDLLADGMTNVSDTVHTIRKGLSDAGFANALGVTLEEARQLAYTFNEVGINFGSLQDDGMSLKKSLETIKDLTITFQASAKSLGVDFGTLVAFSSEFRKELGISVKSGVYMERMSQEFGRIRDLSKQSTLNTKDFFSVVQDLSQGIGSMNIRIGEAANLFVNLSKVLGPEAAQAFTKGLAGGFKGEGIQERFKRIILTGGMKGAFKRTADQTKKDFFALFRSKRTKKIMAEIGIDRATDFSKMSDADLEKKMGELRRKGGAEGEGAARKLMQSVRLSRAGKGGLSNQALALGDLDMSGALSAQFKQLYNVTGGKGFRDVTAIEMEKISQMTGKSLDELEQMRLLDMAMRDDFRVLEEIRDNASDGIGGFDEANMKKAIEEAGLSDKVSVQNGKIVDKQGRVIDNIQDYVHAQGADLDAQKLDSLTQMDLLQEVVNATMTSADVINNHLGSLLQSILDPILSLASWFLRFDTGRQGNLEKAQKTRQEVRVGRKTLFQERKKERERASKRRLEIDKMKIPESKEKAIKEEEKKRKLAEDGFKRRELELKIKKEEAKVYASNIDTGSARGEAIHRLTDEGADQELAGLLQKHEGGGEFLRQQLKRKGVSNADFLAVLKGGKAGDSDHQEFLEKLIKSYGMKASGGDIQRIAEQRGSLGELVMEDIKTTRGVSFGASDEGAKFSQNYYDGNVQATHADSFFSRRNYSSTGDIKLSSGRVEGVSSRFLAEQEELGNLKDYRKEMLSAEDIQKLVENGNMTPAEAKRANEQRAQVDLDIKLKSKKLKDMYSEAQLDALLKHDRDQLKRQVTGELGPGGDFSTESGRKSYINKLDSEITKIYGKEGDLTSQESMDLERLTDLRQQFKRYYAEDAVSATGMTKPMLFHNGYLMEGRSDDSVAFYNPNAPNAGGGGMGGATIINNYNINGNNPSAMLETLKRANQSQGMLMG